MNSNQLQQNVLAFLLLFHTFQVSSLNFFFEKFNFASNSLENMYFLRFLPFPHAYFFPLMEHKRVSYLGRTTIYAL